MTRIIADPYQALQSLVGTELGVSPWRLIGQDTIDAFADATDDHQWIHVDKTRAASGPNNGTIAHGLLLLSFIPAFSSEVYEIERVQVRINYGFDSVRFLSPVPEGSRIRDRITLTAVDQRDTDVKLSTSHTIEIEGRERPACVAASITLLIPTRPQSDPSPNPNPSRGARQ